MPEQLLSVEDLAAFLNVQKSTLYQWRHAGTGPPALKVGKHLRYRPADVEAWLSAQQVA